MVNVSARMYPFPVIHPRHRTSMPYENCVPISTLESGSRSVERRADPHLGGLAEHAQDWAVLDEFKLLKGMFVAQVMSDSRWNRLVPSGSYCLFRPVPGGTKEGRKLLVWHAGLDRRVKPVVSTRSRFTTARRRLMAMACSMSGLSSNRSIPTSVLLC
jgi:hypothetical protein